MPTPAIVPFTTLERRRFIIPMQEPSIPKVFQTLISSVEDFPVTLSQAPYRSLPAGGRKLIHSAAPPFQIAPASLGCDLVPKPATEAKPNKVGLARRGGARERHEGDLRSPNRADFGTTNKKAGNSVTVNVIEAIGRNLRTVHEELYVMPCDWNQKSVFRCGD